MAGADPDIGPLRAKAEKGNSVAQYFLGLVYAEGRAAPKDPVEAYVWLSLAAENGSSSNALGLLVAEMSSDQLAAAKFQLDERRRTTPGVISTPRSGPAAAPAGDHSDVLEQEVAIFRNDKAKLSEELAAAWKEADGAKAAVSAAEERARQAEAALGQRAKDLIAVQTERDQLRAQLAVAPAASAVDALREDRDKLAGRLATATADLQSLRERLAGLEAQNDRLQPVAAGAAQAAASLTILRKDRDELARALAAVQASANELTAQVKKLGEEKVALVQANDRLEQQARRALEATVADQTQKAAAMAAELATTRKELAAAEAGQTQMGAAAGQLEGARQELVSAQKANVELAAQVKKLREERESFNRQLAANGDATRALTALQAKLEGVGSDLGKLRSRNAELTAANQKLDENVRAAALQADETARAKAALASAEQHAGQAEAALGQRTKDLIALQTERDQLRAQLAVAPAASAVAALRQDRDKLAGRLATANADLQSLRERMAGMEAQNDRLHQVAAGVAQAAASLSALQRDRDELARSLAAVQASTNELTAQVKKLGEEKVALAQANGRLEQQARTSDEQASARAEQARRALEATVADQTQKAAAMAAELATTRKELAVAEAGQTQMGAAAGQHEGARQELVSAQKANVELTAQVKKLTEERESFNRQLTANGDATRALTALQAKLEGVGSDLGKLRSRNAELATANQELKDQAQSAAQADQAQSAALAAESVAARKALATAQSANTDLIAQVKKMADEKALLIQQAGRNGEASQELALAKTKLGQVEADLSAMRARATELVAANQKLDEKIRAATLQADETARAKAALASAEQHAGQAEASLGQRDKDLAALQNDLQNTRRTQKDLDAAQAAVAQATASGEQNRRERDDLRQQLDAARQELAAAQATATSHVGENTRQLADLQIQLQKSQRELAELRNQNQLLDEAGQRLERQGKANADAARQLAEAQTALDQLNRKNAGLQAEGASLTARLAQAAAANATMAVAAPGSGDEMARLKEELGRAEEKVEMTVRSFALAQQENERLKAQLDQGGGKSAAQAQDAETALARAKQELAAVQAAADRTAAGSAALRDSLRQLQDANASLVAENAHLKTAVLLAGGNRPAGSGTAPGRPATVAPSALPRSPVPIASALPPTPAPRTHRVAPGDTLTRISNRYYGTTSRWQDIYDANRDKLRNADVLPLDVELRIP